MAKFEMKVAKDDQFFFRLKADNGETILASEMYKSKDGCKNGVESVKKNAGSADRYEKRSSSAEQAYFVLKAANHEIIGTSQQYSSESARDAGIAAVMRAGPGATLDDQTAA